MTQTEKRIIDAVDEQKEDLIAFFRQLIQCRSITGQEQEVAARLRAAVPGAEVKVSEASAVIGAHTGPGAVGICYQGLDAGEPLAEPW